MRIWDILLLIWDPRILFLKLGDQSLTRLSILRRRCNIMLCLLDLHIKVSKNLLNPFDRRFQRFDFLVEMTQGRSFTLQSRIRVRVVDLSSIGEIRYYDSINGTDLCLFQLSLHLCELFLLDSKTFVSLLDLLGRLLNIILELV